jgi:hypothetical protein
MTPKQTERLQKKIKKIKAALAADKRRWGGEYDDSRGLRYIPPRYYVKLGDFAGGMRYMNWFNKNFPDDCGFPDFLFEWTIILFKTGKLKEAEKKAFQTFCLNTYVIDKYFGRPVIPIDKNEFSNIDHPSYTKYFDYSSQQTELSDFTDWLRQFTEVEKFLKLSNKFIEIQKRLKHEDDYETRSYLIKHADQLILDL